MNSNEKVNNTSLLKESESKLIENDSILDPQLYNTLKVFISEGGAPKEATKFVVDSYHGYCDMIKITSGFLKICGHSNQEIESMIIEDIKTEIFKHFDIKNADSIFLKTTTKPPEWLNYMISKPTWRNLIYKLSEMYPDCYLLNFSIQKICANGHIDEISHFTSSSTNFNIFHNVLVNLIDKLSTKTEEELLIDESFLDFLKITCYNQYTYLYTHCLLRELSKIINLRRLMEAVELNLSTKKNNLLSQTIPLEFLKYDSLKDGIDPSDISDALISMYKTKKTNPSDVIKLYKAYKSTNPPSKEFLQNLHFFEIFVSDLYTPYNIVNEEHKSKYVYLLAYASCTIEDEDVLNQTISAINSSLEICSTRIDYSNIEKSTQELMPLLKYNVICMGIIKWIEILFTHSQFFVSSYNINSTSLFMDLLKGIATNNEIQCSSILELLSKLFTVHTDLDVFKIIEIKKLYLDVFVYLLFELNFVLPVLKSFKELCLSQSLDFELIRHFFGKIFNMIEKPYSNEFTDLLKEILSFSRIL
eukprot:gene9737-2064_t